MNSSQNQIVQAFNLFQQGRLIEAETLFHTILKRDRKNHDAQHYLGILKVAKGDLDEGLELLRSSLKQPHTFRSYSENYASTLFQAGCYQPAIAFCKNTIAKIGVTESLQYVLACSLLRLEQHVEAISAFLAEAEITADPAYIEHARAVAARAKAMHGIK